MSAPPRVVCFATQGAGSGDEGRILDLLAGLAPERFAFDRSAKRANVTRLLRELRARRPDLVVMEGTGLAGGLALLLGRALFGVPYVISSGDAVGPFLGAHRRALAVPGWIYEALLCRLADGFIGWTPYLAGRALTFGTPRAITVANPATHPTIVLSRTEVRRRLGVPDGALVAGIVGSLRWNEQRGYCYGWELVRALRHVRRTDLAVVIVGGGTGLDRLRALAGDDPRIILPGPIPPEHVVSYLAAMDIGSLPQSVDQVGAFRYTTKLPEYVAARLPVVTGQLPVAYDLMDGWAWRLAGEAPWDERYLAALAALLEHVRPEEIAARRAAMPAQVFPADEQRRRAAEFVRDLVAHRRQPSSA